MEEMFIKLVNDNAEGHKKGFINLDEDNCLEQLKNFYNASDEKVRKVIEDVVRSIDVDVAIKESLKICKIGEIETLWVKAMLNYRKISILKCIESAKIDIDVAQKPNVVFSKRR